MASRPYLGHGVGLRVEHYELALAGAFDVDWAECITENFFGGGGRPRAVLARLRRDRPLAFHGVSMGLGSDGGPSDAYLSKLSALVEEYEPVWISDHVCWTHFQGHHSHDLLPLPYTEEAIRRVVSNLARVQERLRRPLLVENVSSYVGFRTSEVPEWEFLNEICSRSGCRLLLDLNNVLVNATNHGFAAHRLLDAIEVEYVVQLHLANHTDRGHYKFDSHAGAVPAAVWHLYEHALDRFGAVSTLIEWDEGVPEWARLRAEAEQAREREQRVLSVAASHG